tara:strand:+ start:46 stop:654 length:609 start_codon:yes stop_codon:yes gene_type:complete
MEVLDLFCGTKSLKPIVIEKGWKYIGLDIEEKFNPEICMDFLDWNYKNFVAPDILWASPDCSVYSMAAGSKSFNKDREPVSDKAKLHLKILDKLKKVINYYLEQNPNLIYYVENPTARMVWFMTDYPRYDISYCKYGFDRMKPTTIWSNIEGFIPKKCKKKDNCTHIKAPRGSNTGTQGIPRNERYKIPPKLIFELLSHSHS